MNPGIHVAHAAAAKAQRNLLGRFRLSQAVDAPRALELPDLPRLETRALERLVDEGVVRRVQRRYYLDERQLREHGERQKQKARVIVLSFFAATVVVLTAIALSLATR
jgi:hypothetical protein